MTTHFGLPWPGAFRVSMVALALGTLMTKVSAGQTQPDAGDDAWAAGRQAMVRQLRAYRIADERLLEIMGRIRRHLFIPAPLRDPQTACADAPAPIGFGQTISQPYIVAHMTERLRLKPGEKILEIGTGSGYQAAVLAALGAAVYSVEIVPELAQHARQVLDSEGFSAVQTRTGNGYQGWPEHAPFDAIIVTCAPEAIPPALVDQLRDGGRMIVPVGRHGQRLVILRKKGGRVEIEEDLPVRFVPMVHGNTNAPRS